VRLSRRPRTVSGPTDRVVVVGAGLAGLSTAMRLAAAGRRVTVLEREQVPGGRAGLLVRTTPEGTYRFDTGPTVLTMPDLIEDCFAALGERMEDWLTLRRVEPLYRAQVADGTALDVRSDTEAMAAEVEALAGAAAAGGYLRFVEFVTRLYRYEMADFIDRNIDSPFDLLTPNLARLAAAGGFRRLAPLVARYLPDERLQRVFSFQALYAGVSPHEALALYAVITYMDAVAGVYFPAGGMHALPAAMAAAAEKHGVELRYGCTVTAVEHSGGRATAVLTADGDRVGCDAVVLNPDLPVARRDLLGAPLRRRLRYSPSCFLLLAGSSTSYPGLVHHTISFGQSWRSVFEDLGEGRLMHDPSVLVSCPTVPEPALAPAGRQSYYVLLPTPNTTADLDWESLLPRYREHAVTTLEQRGFDGFSAGIEVEDITTPADWEALGMQAGTPFAASHTFAQTGPFRPGNLWGENVVFTGSGTIPGVGVPMVLVSGRLAAERITG
jgi:phytoene desaturase